MHPAGPPVLGLTKMAALGFCRTARSPCLAHPLHGVSLPETWLFGGISLSQALSLGCLGSHNRRYLLPLPVKVLCMGVSLRRLPVTPLPSPHSSVWKLCTPFPTEKRFCLFFFFSLRDSESVAPKLPPVQWGPGSSVFQPVTFGTGSGSQPADPIAGGSSPPGSPVSARVHPL